MQKKLVTALLKHKAKFGLQLNEATSLSNICCLIAYVQFHLPKIDNPINILLLLTELTSQTAEAICMALLDERHKCEIDDCFLSECLVSLICNGAVVMLSHKGVARLLLDCFPSIIMWQCLNHRLELSVDDSLTEVAGINSFNV
jgi:hypothetical protein